MDLSCQERCACFVFTLYLLSLAHKFHLFSLVELSVRKALCEPSYFHQVFNKLLLAFLGSWSFIKFLWTIKDRGRYLGLMLKGLLSCMCDIWQPCCIVSLISLWLISSSSLLYLVLLFLILLLVKTSLCSTPSLHLFTQLTETKTKENQMKSKMEGPRDPRPSLVKVKTES